MFARREASFHNLYDLLGQPVKSSYLCAKLMNEVRAMPRKKDGMLFEIHPTPAKGKDGKNILYVRPVSGHELTISAAEITVCATASCREPSMCFFVLPVS